MRKRTRRRVKRSATLGMKLRGRGMALLMVMIALVVGAVLLTSYLSTQGTALGIARNDSDAMKARLAAESGLDMGVWLVKSDSTWRQDMTPGNWLSNYALNDAQVELTAASGDGAASFIDYLTNPLNPNYGGSLPGTPPPLILTSTATYNGISSSVRARLTSTGGGRPWRNGMFVQQSLSPLDSTVLDSYNTVTGVFGGVVPLFSNNTSDPLGGLLNLVGGLLGGLLGTVGQVLGLVVHQPPAILPRTVGQLIVPATDNFQPYNAASGNNYSASGTFSAPLTGATYYNDIEVATARSTVSVGNGSPEPMVVWVQDKMEVLNGAVLQIQPNSTVIFVVDGTLNIKSTVKVMPGAKVVFFVRNTITIDSGAQVNTLSGNPNQCVLVAGSDGMTCQFVGSPSTTYAVVLAPTTDVQMNNSAVLYGSVIANSLKMQGSSKLHYDPNTVAAEYHGIKGGSYQGDLTVQVDHPGGPAL